jgi:hypothetical protein
LNQFNRPSCVCSTGSISVSNKYLRFATIFGAVILLVYFAGCSKQSGHNRQMTHQEPQRRFVQQANAPNKLMQWIPRNHDIPKSPTAERDEFLFILATAINTSYTVRQGDCLDRIIRDHFFVSGLQQPRAYTAYKSEIQARNRKTLRVIQPGQTLVLPSGPHYAALESTIDSRDAYLERMAGLLNSPESLRKLATKESSIKGSANSEVAGVNRSLILPPSHQVLLTRGLTFKIFQTLGHFTRAYPSPEENVKITGSRRNSSVDELIERRVLPPTSLRPGIDTELVSVYVPRNVEMPSGLRISSSPETLARFENPDADVADNCGGDCKKCSELLGMPPPKGPLNSRLLLVDTGVDSNVSTPSLYYGPLKSPPNAQKDSSTIQNVPATPEDVPIAGTDKTLQDFSDPSSNHHGTFIYREIVDNGLLPPETVQVARVAVKVDYPGDYVLSVRHIVAATNRFVGESLLPVNKNSGVQIASLSFGGEVSDVDQAHLGLETTSRILYVVAAGNAEGSNREIDANYVYPKFNGTLSNLLVVGALNSKDQLATYSRINRANVDLFARGSCVCGGRTKPDGDDDQQLYGTSQAAPIAATAATILADRHPSWNAQQIKWRLISTTDLQDDLYDKGIGGNLNLGAALNYQSVLVRLPLHRSVVEKVNSILSKNQQVEISTVDKSNSGWSVLLDAPTQVFLLSSNSV